MEQNGTGASLAKPAGTQKALVTDIFVATANRNSTSGCVDWSAATDEFLASSPHFCHRGKQKPAPARSRFHRWHLIV